MAEWGALHGAVGLFYGLVVLDCGGDIWRWLRIGDLVYFLCLWLLLVSLPCRDCNFRFFVCMCLISSEFPIWCHDPCFSSSGPTHILIVRFHFHIFGVWMILCGFWISLWRVLRYCRYMFWFGFRVSQWPCKPLLVLGSFRLEGNLLLLGSCRISWLVRLCFPPSWSYCHCGTWWWSSCFACNYSWLWLCFCWRFYEACVQQGSALWLTWWIAPLRLSSHLHRSGDWTKLLSWPDFFCFFVVQECFRDTCFVCHI